jgi:hypothetical protein
MLAIQEVGKVGGGVELLAIKNVHEAAFRYGFDCSFVRSPSRQTQLINPLRFLDAAI